jgi:hypothetical protein
MKGGYYMKRILAILLAVIMCVAVLAACNDPDPAPPGPNGGGGGDGGGGGGGDAPPAGGGKTINVWSFTDEIPDAIVRFKELNPGFDYEINITVIATDGGGYQQALDAALLAGGSDAPDIFTAESAFVLKYTQADVAHFALPYSDLFGRDVMPMINDAQIATYAWELGTRPSDNQVVGLPFQATGSAFIYRRSLAEQIWGSDDPATVQTKIGPGWNKFLEAAEEAKAHGIAILPGEGDAWQAIRSGATTPWIQNERLVLDSHREQYLDIGYALYNNDYTTKVGAWSDGWFAAMGGNADMPVLGLLGPAWLINYVMVNNVGDTWGDWAICEPPTGFSWGGTWVIANARGNEDVRAGVAQIIEWITLDTTDNGFQFKFANGTLFEGSTLFPEQAADFADGKFTKDTVASGVVMARSNGILSLLGDQDMFDIFIPAGANASGAGFGPYDETINSQFNDQAGQYFMGNKTRDEAIADFKQAILDELDFPS